MLDDVELYVSPTKKITAYVMKIRGELVFRLQEWDSQGDGFWGFMMFGSWSPSVAREPCKRATQKVVDSFYSRHFPLAKRMVDERVAVLEAPITQEAS